MYNKDEDMGSVDVFNPLYVCTTARPRNEKNLSVDGGVSAYKDIQIS